MTTQSADGHPIEDGVPVYGWRTAPQHLRTRRQLAENGLQPNRQDVAGKVPFRNHGREQVAYLYDVNQAAPKRIPTDTQLEALAEGRREQQLRAAERHGFDRADFESIGDPGPGWDQPSEPPSGPPPPMNAFAAAAMQEMTWEREGFDR